MAKSSAGKGGTENVNHFAALRARVIGNGNWQISVSSLNNVKTKTLTPIVLLNPTDIEPLRLVNFVSQRAAFAFETVNENEWFQVNALIFWQKPIFIQYPA